MTRLFSRRTLEFLICSVVPLGLAVALLYGSSSDPGGLKRVLGSLLGSLGKTLAGLPIVSLVLDIFS